jgi:hypothetical protein
MAYTETELRAVQEHFGFLRPAPVEKDWHVTRPPAHKPASADLPYLDVMRLAQLHRPPRAYRKGRFYG